MDMKTTFRNLVRDQSVSICMLQEPSHVSQLSLNYLCRIRVKFTGMTNLHKITFLPKFFLKALYVVTKNYTLVRIVSRSSHLRWMSRAFPNSCNYGTQISKDQKNMFLLSLELGVQSTLQPNADPQNWLQHQDMYRDGWLS